MVVASETTLPYTGREFLDSLDDGREVWIYGQRVSGLSIIQRFATRRA